MFQQFVNAIGASIDDIIDVEPVIEETDFNSDFDSIYYEQEYDMQWGEILYETDMFDKIERRRQKIYDSDDESGWELEGDEDDYQTSYEENRHFARSLAAKKQREEEEAEEQFDRDFAYNRQFALENPPDEETILAYAAAIERTIAITGRPEFFNPALRK
jgi:hypothetical protein